MVKFESNVHADPKQIVENQIKRVSSDAPHITPHPVFSFLRNNLFVELS